MTVTGWIIYTVVTAIGIICANIAGYALGRAEERRYWGARRKPRDKKFKNQ